MQADSLSLEGRVALVTGAGRGIGRALARAFAGRGARVAVADLDPGSAESAAGAIRAGGGRAVGLAADVRDEASVRSLFDRIESELGPADIVVNNAGVTVQKPAVELTVAEWDFVQSVCLTGTFLCARTAAARWIERGKTGCIVNIASINGVVAPAFHASSAYAAAKAGVIGLTRALAVEWGGSGIRVNAICPTYVKTEMTAARLAEGDYASKIVGRTPLGRIAEPDDMAGAVLFLASPAASMITGQALPVDGGWTIV